MTGIANRVDQSSWAASFGGIVPILQWLPEHNRASLHWVLLTGVAAAALLISASMAYMQHASLTPVVGLYAATVLLIIYGWLRMSRQLQHGPSSTVVIMLAAAILPMASAAGFFQSFLVDGSLSRSSVNAGAGGDHHHVSVSHDQLLRKLREQQLCVMVKRARHAVANDLRRTAFFTIIGEESAFLIAHETVE